MVANEQRMQHQEATGKNLEVQLWQLAKIVSSRAQGTLPSDIEKNPREHVKEVTLRNGKELEEVVKSRDDPSKLNDLVLHDVQVEKAKARKAR